MHTHTHAHTHTHTQEPVFELDPELERQKAERAADAAKQQDEVEARMAKWMAEAAAKKAAEGGN